MKVIDLLVKIANDEEVPEKIKFLYCTFEYDKDNLKYKNIEKGKNDLLEYIDFYKGIVLNDEVEIIEDIPKEDKKIEKLEYWLDVKSWGESDLGKGLGEQSEFNKNIYYKINEIIDKVNGE